MSIKYLACEKPTAINLSPKVLFWELCLSWSTVKTLAAIKVGDFKCEIILAPSVLANSNHTVLTRE